MTAKQFSRLKRLRERARRKRGVVLLIVVSLLVLFVLLGVTYAVIASRYKDTATASKRLEFYRDKPQSELDRVFYDLLREPGYQYSGINPVGLPLSATYDTARASAAAGIGNPSALAGHSLLRDLYGMHASGFAQIADTSVDTPELLVPQNQFVRFRFTNTTTLHGDPAGASDTPNAYTGCWIHFTTGALANESVRIRLYNPPSSNTGFLPEVVVDAVSYSGRPLHGPTGLDLTSNLANSQFLLSGRPFGGTGHGWQPGNYAKHTPNTDNTAGTTNPVNPTWGVTYYTGLTPTAIGDDVQDPVGQLAGLTQTDGWQRVYDFLQFGSTFPQYPLPPNPPPALANPDTTPKGLRQSRRYYENLVALMPHFSKYDNAARSMNGLVDPSLPYTPSAASNSVALRNLERDAGPNPYGVREDALIFANPRQIQPSNAGAQSPTYAPLNPDQGGANEPYDAYDPQNMFLSMLMPISASATAGNPSDFYAGPSFHQGALINYWFNRMITPVVDSVGNLLPQQSGPLNGITTRNLQVAAFLFPFGIDGVLDPNDATIYWGASPPADWDVRLRYVESVTRRIMFRPSAAMNPNFTGSNPFIYDLVNGAMTVARNGMPTRQTFSDLLNSSDPTFGNQVISDVINNFRTVFPAGQGPFSNAFDVDNDNDDIRDSVWVDPGLPIVTMPDGRRYKRLVAIMVKDMDNRLNINAVGSYAQVDPITGVTDGYTPGVANNNYPPAPPSPPAPASPAVTPIMTFVNTRSPIDLVNGDGSVNLYLTRGLGVGPADIDMSVIFYGSTAPQRRFLLSQLLSARYSSVLEPNVVAGVAGSQPGTPGTGAISNDAESFRKLVGPVTTSAALNPYNYLYGFGHVPGTVPNTNVGYTLMGATPIDIFGRGTIYLDKNGSPIFYNYGYDDITFNPYGMSPYGNRTSDSPFTLNDLERLLRSTDLDIASANTRATIALGVEANNRRVRDSLTTMSSHIPSLNFSAPQWLKKTWTKEAANNVATQYTNYPLVTAQLQRLLSSASVIEIAKARLPAIPADARTPYSAVRPASLDPMGSTDWYFGTPNETIFTQPAGGRILSIDCAAPWQRHQVGTTGTQAEIEQISLNGWDPGLRFEHITHDDQLRRMLPWEILHGEKLNLNRYLENDAPSYGGWWGTVNELSTPYFHQNDVPDIRGYYRANRTAALNGSFDASNVYLSQRQLLARHLYCLLSLVVDPDVADFMFRDEIQYRMERYNQTTPGFAGLPRARWAAREMLARKMAQWAVNAVDMMDRDGVMTAFEYDVNPWNGWSVDGILGTEDDRDNINFPERRLVWGTEQPDLLITESLNMHDRGVMDTPVGRMRVNAAPPPTNSRDLDLDQGMIPQGSTFLELWCPRPLSAKPLGGNPATDPERYGAYLPPELYSAGRLNVGAVTLGNTPVWRVAISEHIPADNETRQDYLPEYNVWTPFAPQSTLISGMPLVRPSFTFEPSYDGDGSGGTAWEYVATTPFFGFRDDAGAMVSPSPFIADGIAGDAVLNPPRSHPYMAEYTSDANNRWKCRIGLERFIYFTGGGSAGNDDSNPPNLNTKVCSNTTGDITRTFVGDPVSVAPQQYLVIGPRETTYFGAQQGDPVDPSNPDDTMTRAWRAWSNRRIQINNLGTVATYDAAGNNITPATINTPIAVIARRRQIDTVGRLPTPINEGYAGLSVTEPLQLSPNAQYYPSPTHGNYFYGVIPFDSTAPADQTFFDTPLEYKEAPTDGRKTPLHELEKSTVDPRLGGPMQKSGTYDNRRIAFLQRLSDPRVAWHRDYNPYITIDFHTMDVTSFSGLISTRRTVTTTAPTSEADGNDPQRAIDTLPVDDNMDGHPDFVNDGAFGGDMVTDLVNQIAPPDRVRCQTITRERGFRTYPWSNEAHDYSNTNGKRILNVWNPLSMSTSRDWEGTSAVGNFWGHSVYVNGLHLLADPTATTDVAWNSGLGQYTTAPLPGTDPLSAFRPPATMPNYPLRIAGTNDWRRMPDYAATIWEQGTPGVDVLDINSYPLAPDGTAFLTTVSNTFGYLNRSLGRRQPLTSGYVGHSDEPAPWNGFHDRTLANPMELLTVPASPAARWGMDFIIPALSHDHTAATRGKGSVYSANANDPTVAGAWGANGLYPSLLNMFWSSGDTEYIDEPTGAVAFTPQTQYEPTGLSRLNLVGSNQKRADFARIFDLIDTPSRFNGTTDFFDEVAPTSFRDNLNPAPPVPAPAPAAPFPVQKHAFNVSVNRFQPRYATATPNNGTDIGKSIWSGLESYRFPYNYSSKMREPGKINLNTLYDLNVYMALMGPNSAAATTYGNDGFFRFLFSRRGIPLALEYNNTSADSYGTDTVLTNVPVPIQTMLPNVAFPSLINNPFRPASAADLMPAPVYVDRGNPGNSNLRHNMTMRTQAPVDATILRKDLSFPPTAPFGEQPLFSHTSPNVTGQTWTDNRPGTVDQIANPYFRFQGQEQLANLVSGTSNVFAIWITIGYFEVEPNYVNREGPDSSQLGATTRLPMGFVTPAQISQAATAQGMSTGQYLATYSNYIHIEYDVNHPDGTRLGAELGADDATFARHRAFYVVDRSIPVAFEPGKTHNTERCVLLKRFIE